MKYQFIEYQKKINELRMLRSDLSEKTITKEIQKIASESPVSTISVLTRSVFLAMKGEPVQWETWNYQILEKQ